MANLTADDVRAVQYAEMIASDARVYETTPLAEMRQAFFGDEPVDDQTFAERVARYERGQELMQSGYVLRSGPGGYQSTYGIPTPDDSASDLVFEEAGWAGTTRTYRALYLTR